MMFFLGIGKKLVLFPWTDGRICMRKRAILTLAMVSLAASSLLSAEAAPDRGRQLFMSHCSKCHTNGQNAVKPSKPVVGSSVLATFATFRSYLDKPIGTMPHYSYLITDEAALRDLYTYVKSLDDEETSKNSDKTDKSASKKEDQKKVLEELNKDIPKKKVKKSKKSKCCKKCKKSKKSKKDDKAKKSEASEKK